MTRRIALVLLMFPAYRWPAYRTRVVRVGESRIRVTLWSRWQARSSDDYLEIWGESGGLKEFHVFRPSPTSPGSLIHHSWPPREVEQIEGPRSRFRSEYFDVESLPYRGA